MTEEKMYRSNECPVVEKTLHLQEGFLVDFFKTKVTENSI